MGTWFAPSKNAAALQGRPALRPHLTGDPELSGPAPSLSGSLVTAFPMRVAQSQLESSISLGRLGMCGAQRERFPQNPVKSGSRTFHSPLRPTDCLCPSIYSRRNRRNRDLPVTHQVPGRSATKSQLSSYVVSGSSHFVVSNLFTKERNQRSCISSNLV